MRRTLLLPPSTDMTSDGVPAGHSLEDILVLFALFLAVVALVLLEQAVGALKGVVATREEFHHLLHGPKPSAAMHLTVQCGPAAVVC